ncbi:MAG: N-6 DNA methylase, partial [Anaerolineae bacterium]|nr:N-6 DNA methylase [Anaerolineae bacterium]
NAPLNTPRDLAWLLASYARAALHTLNNQPAEALAPLKAAMYKALGIQFTDEDGDHFFRSSLVQTLFYGLFSAWIAYNALPDSSRPPRFDWQDASDYLGLPLLAELFETIARPRQLREMAIRDLVEWAEAALNRVQWEVFSRVFDQDNAINYFYEPFLEAYDPELRRQLGVWYTPPEVVRYMVRRVDHALRTELSLPDGLADEHVIILDPCCGTGAYLLETLRCIQETLARRGSGALLGAALKKAACERVLGFEILPAPFVVAHMQIGMLLTRLGNPLRESQRAAIYLTNALSGWQARSETDPMQIEGFPKLRQEAVTSLRVKRKEKILVVIGNPPYNGYAGVAVQEESELIAAYRQVRRAPPPQGQGLNDLYVRFFRVAERKIVEGTGRGVVCFISNYSWLDGLSHTGMRERYLEVFDRIIIDNLNGDRFRTGKLTPDGKPDPSIFSSEHNREGIQVGTAITTLIRTTPHHGVQTVLYRDLWGVGKLRQLAAEATAPAHDGYRALELRPELGFPFMPRTVSADYLSWARLPDLFHKYFPGVKTSRDEDLVEIDRDVLE